jgi:hypothetical protein
LIETHGRPAFLPPNTWRQKAYDMSSSLSSSKLLEY